MRLIYENTVGPYLSHQKMYNVRSLLEYDEEINIALQIIKSENNDHVTIKGAFHRWAYCYKLCREPFKQ